MQWKDGNSLSARTVYGVLRGSLRIRRATRELRAISALTLSAITFLLLGLALQSWILFGAFVVIVTLNAAQWLYFRYFIETPRIDELDEMTGWEFEKWLRRFFERVGYRVTPTPYSGDFGADFVLTWNGIRIAVQAKRASRPVGVSAVQQVVAAKAYYDCERAMVVTNGYFTEQAAILARTNGVWLRSRDDLARKAADLDREKQKVMTEDVKRVGQPAS
jgi:restriction system protein